MNLALIDDDPMFCSSISAAFKMHTRLRFVLMCNSGKEFFAQYQKYELDLILLDFVISQKNGMEIMREMTEKGIGIPVIVFSNYLYKEYADQFYELGVKRVIRKSSPELLEKEILNYFKDNGKENAFTKLSEEEFILLQLICEEKSISEIAELINKSEISVKKKKTTLAFKLKIGNSDIQFLKLAIKFGYYPAPA